MRWLLGRSKKPKKAGQAHLRPHKERDRNPALAKYRAGGERAGDIGPITYRAYRQGDEASILSGFNETFKLERDLDYWHWKFKPDPLGRFMSVAVDGADEVLAFYAAAPLFWQYDGVKKLTGLGADVYCRRHPELIRRGVFIEILNHFLSHNMGENGLAMVFGFAGRTASRLYMHKTPYIGPHPIRLYEREVVTPAMEPVSAPFSVARGGYAVDLLDELWRRVSPRHARIAVRDSVWARHRFVDRPDVDYETFMLIDEAGLPAAWGAFTTQGEVFHVCDILWDGRPEALEQADRLFQAEAANSGAGKSLMVLQNAGDLERVFKRAGWQATVYPHGGSWIMQTADPAIGEDILESFYLTFADTDLV